MLTAATPAYASTIDVNNSGVAAAADFSWLGQSIMADMVLYIRDTACDDNDVYAKLTFYTTAGEPTSSGIWRNSLGCSTSRVIDLGTLSVAGRLTGVRLTACIDDLNRNTCVSSGFLDNPNT